MQTPGVFDRVLLFRFLSIGPGSYLTFNVTVGTRKVATTIMVMRMTGKRTSANVS